MKKLMIAAAAVACAVMANASTVKWSVDGYDSADTDCITGFFINSQTAGEEFTAITLANAIAMIEAGNAQKLFNDYAANWDVVDSKKAVSDTSTADSAWGDGESVTVYAITFDVDDETKLADATAYRATGVSEAINFTGAKQTKTALQTVGEWQSIPEPTSGLLLLIGVAGLALRRRRA